MLFPRQRRKAVILLADTNYTIMAIKVLNLKDKASENAYKKTD